MTVRQRHARKRPPKATVLCALSQGATCLNGRIVNLDIRQIKCYEKNPRRTPNPEHDRIKASIQTAGLEQPLRVTQRPGDSQYVVQGGGNTRLQILKELFQTTGEARFGRVDCLAVDWDRESSVLLAHLRENELRGDLTFIDKAQAVANLSQLLAEELGVGMLSSRDLAGLLKERGYSVSFGLITQMDYAVSVLLPRMPMALRSGLGKAQVQRIRHLEGLARAIWMSRAAGTEAEFTETFGELCRRHDGPDWQFEPLLQALEVEIAEAAEVGIQVVRMELTCRLAGRAPEVTEFAPEDQSAGDFPVAARDEPAVVSEAERQAEAAVLLGVNDVRVDYPSGQGATSAAAGAPAGESLDVGLQWPDDIDREQLVRRLVQPAGERIPLELLRQRASRLAERLATRHGLGEVITPCTEDGVGFLVLNVPDAGFLAELDEALGGQVVALWWQLFAFSDMRSAPRALLAARVEAGSKLARSLLTGDEACAEPLPDALDPGALGERFWSRLSHDDWCDWLALAHNYRQMHQLTRELGRSLWSAAP